MTGHAGVSSGPRAKILLMRSPQWLFRKNRRLPVALYSALWWGGCALFCYVAAAAIASADLQGARAATIQFTGQCSPAPKNDRHCVPTKPADKVPQRAVFHTYGALNSIVLRPGRKPGPYDASAPAALATWLCLDEDRELRLLSKVALHRPVGRSDIYLQCCSLLI
jgi:hypothetical protein